MQAAAARTVGQAGVRSVLRGALLVTGVAARASKRTVERLVRREALLYLTGKITLANILRYATATFEEVPPALVPESAPVPESHVGARIVGGLIVFAGAVLVVHSIADAVDVHCRTRNRRCRPYPQTELRHSRSSDEAPSLYPKPQPAPPLPEAIEYFDARRAIAAWTQECQAAGIKHRMLNRK
jgi:hypothetical protein